MTHWLATLSELYGLSFTSLDALAGEVDQNFRIKSEEGDAYLLKITAPATEEASLRFQVALLAHLNEQTLHFKIPKPIARRDGTFYGQHILPEIGSCFIRVYSWVPGRMLATVKPRSYPLLANWGRMAAELTVALAGFTHSDAPTDYKWNPSQALESRPLSRFFTASYQHELADYFWEMFIHRALPQLPILRKSINYNDAHEHNLLVEEATIDPHICGLIDFGDAMFTQTINELAIACAYAAMDFPDPLVAIVEVVKAYHTIFPLQDLEIEVLFPLIAARLLISVSQSAYHKKEAADNAYLQISEQAAWALLLKMRKLHPVFVLAQLRYACGLTVLSQPDFEQWAKRSASSFHPILPLANRQVVAIDCSVGSKALGGYSDFIGSEAFAASIQRMIQAAGGAIGVGGYREVRPFYTTAAYQTEGNDGPRWRTTHLGYDCWMPAGTAVSVPYPATVHSFGYDAADRSYGATIILAHHPNDYPVFYSLYGHLNKAALEGLYVGKTLAAGTVFAQIGTYEENGGWPPHLHFQLMLDMLGQTGDFPGVAYPEEAAVWLALCPDPRLLMPDLPSQLRSDPAEQKITDLLAKRKKQLGYNLSLSYQQPLHILRGWGAYLLDHSGRRYLDTVNNVAHVGHEHPKVVAAGQRQLAVLNTNTRYLHEEIVAFAEALTATLPEALSVVYFVNSGSEANELALRMASAWSGGSRHMLAIEAGYHGNTSRTIEVSSYKFDRKGGSGRPSYTELLPLPDTYRGLHRDPATAGRSYAAYATEAIARIQAQGHRLAGFIAESILSCGGQIVLPAGYLAAVYAAVRAAGGLCVADEVQVGLGRVGTHFWGFELQGVVPDIVTIGKPIGNGYPLGAVVCTTAVATAFANGMEYFNTFGGSPVACAIGQSVLSVLREEALQENAAKIGAYLQAGFLELQSDFPIIGQWRGQGLFQGIELVEDPNSRKPAQRQAAYLANRMRQLACLMSTDGPDENILKIKPPMCFSSQDADQLFTYLRQVLQEDAAQP